MAILNTQLEEAKLDLNEDGLHAGGADPANVALVDAKLTRSAFESYTGNGGQVGVDLEKLIDVASMANNGDLINLDLDPETRKLDIQIEGLNYTCALIDPDSIREVPDIPEMDLSTTATAEGSELHRAVDATDLVSDYIKFIIDGDSATEFTVEGVGDTDSVDLTISEADDDVEEITTQLEADESHSSMFDLEYISELFSEVDKDTPVTIEFGDDFPIQGSFGFADGTGSAEVMSAPRIQSD